MTATLDEDIKEYEVPDHPGSRQLAWPVHTDADAR